MKIINKKNTIYVLLIKLLNTLLLYIKYFF